MLLVILSHNAGKKKKNQILNRSTNWTSPILSVSYNSLSYCRHHLVLNKAKVILYWEDAIDFTF